MAAAAGLAMVSGKGADDIDVRRLYYRCNNIILSFRYNY